ncbi:MAG: RsmB/NOP family class I SAM-dependent RNA methyltransferase, partial [Candidatus Hydrogenedentes bacterium]|nr:RsmB/NOP family class I SAM-dependent RNA methyltransferase [Candidatus Hydrogenedentota bacterium]
LRTKLFGNGRFFIQDPASMLPAHLLEPEAGDRILDLCAAPGGKTTHLAELARGKAAIVALDRHLWRAGLIVENAQRLATPGIMVACADGTQPPVLPGFDRVLVDAPCTGLGTLRRHPDLKWRVKREDPARLAETQRALLRSAVQLCKNAGVIVYSVCTLSSEETEGVVRSIVDEGAVVPEDGPEWLDQWKTETGKYRTRLDEGGLDGFFLTRLRKAC